MYILHKMIAQFLGKNYFDSLVLLFFSCCMIAYSHSFYKTEIIHNYKKGEVMVSIWKCSRSIQNRSVHSDVVFSWIMIYILDFVGVFFVILQLFLFLWYNWPEWLGGPIFELQLAIWKEYEIALRGAFWWVCEFWWWFYEIFCFCDIIWLID